MDANSYILPHKMTFRTSVSPYVFNWPTTGACIVDWINLANALILTCICMVREYGNVPACVPSTEEGCSDKEREYIKKQSAMSSEKKMTELERLSRLLGDGNTLTAETRFVEL